MMTYLYIAIFFLFLFFAIMCIALDFIEASNNFWEKERREDAKIKYTWKKALEESKKEYYS